MPKYNLQWRVFYLGQRMLWRRDRFQMREQIFQKANCDSRNPILADHHWVLCQKIPPILLLSGSHLTRMRRAHGPRQRGLKGRSKGRHTRGNRGHAIRMCSQNLRSGFLIQKYFVRISLHKTIKWLKLLENVFNCTEFV